MKCQQICKISCKKT